jgi:tRNA-dihydrouridine synthase B
MPLEKNFVRDIMLDHLGGLYQFYGETTGVRVARKHLIWYCAGLKNRHPFRTRVVRVDSASEQLRLTRDYFDDSATDLAAQK